MSASGPPPSPAPGDPVRGTLRVYADSSLQQVMAPLAAEFAALHPGVKVRFTYGATSSLVSRLPGSADVIAVLGNSALGSSVSAGTVGSPTSFARDPIALTVTQQDPRGVTQFNDVSRPGVTLAACAPSQPCGQVADLLIRTSGVHPASVLRVADSPAVLAAVHAGRADAGLALSSDLHSRQATSDMLRRIGFKAGDPMSNQSATEGTVLCLAAPVTSSTNKATAAAFVSELGSPDARATLTNAGFGR